MTRVGPERDSPTKEDSRVICVVSDHFSVTLPLLYNTSDCSRFFRPIRRPWHKQRGTGRHSTSVVAEHLARRFIGSRRGRAAVMSIQCNGTPPSDPTGHEMWPVAVLSDEQERLRSPIHNMSKWREHVNAMMEQPFGECKRARGTVCSRASARQARPQSLPRIAPEDRECGVDHASLSPQTNV